MHLAGSRSLLMNSPEGFNSILLSMPMNMLGAVRSVRGLIFDIGVAVAAMINDFV